MPFKSEKQRKYLWANEPEIARDWTDTYGSKIHKADGGRIGLRRGSDRHAGTGSNDNTAADRANQAQAQARARTSHHSNEGGYRPTHVRSGITPPKQPERDGIIQSIKNFPDSIRRRGIKRNLDYYMGGKKLDFPVWAGILKGPQEEEDYYTDFAGLSPIEMQQRYEGTLSQADMDRVQHMSSVLGQDKVTQSQFEDAFYGPKGPPQPDTGGEGGGQPYIWPYETASAPIEEEEIVVADSGLGSGHFRVPEQYRVAEGGRIPAAYGGIMDSYTGRRAYGIGSSIKKAFKKATKAVKKLVSSDIGKLAMLYGAGTYLGGTQALSGQMGGAGTFAERLRDPKLLANLVNAGGTWGTAGTVSTAGQPVGVQRLMPGGNKILPKTSLWDKGVAALKNPWVTIPAAGAAAGLMTAKMPVEELDDVQGEWDEDKEAFDAYLASLGGSYRVPDEYIKSAQGGRIGKQEGGLMDLGGMEKDYRNDGGFVPLGGEEKADDVPARLSKNEFVFTADAVRNAGGGDIDRGAEVMENVMKNLEGGGQISEESQGQGAQEMFETSERLSEVI